MSRTMTPAFAEALAADDLRPALLFEGDFATGVVRLWSGLGPLVWDGRTWQGAGTLIGIAPIEETGDIIASGSAVALSGVPADLVQLVIAEARQGMPGRVWLGLLSAQGTIIADPVLAFAGRLDVPEIADDGARCTVTIAYESRLIDLGRPRAWRYTHESQAARFAGDRGFEYVTTIQQQDITWGRT